MEYNVSIVDMIPKRIGGSGRPLGETSKEMVRQYDNCEFGKVICFEFQSVDDAHNSRTSFKNIMSNAGVVVEKIARRGKFVYVKKRVKE